MRSTWNEVAARHALVPLVHLNDAKLSAAAKALIEDPATDVEISPASYWEIAIKISLGKYSLPQPYQEFMEFQIAANDVRVLHIEPKHTAQLTIMPYHHKDPFDRLLIAQAIVESMPIVSGDEALDAYAVQRLW